MQNIRSYLHQKFKKKSLLLQMTKLGTALLSGDYSVEVEQVRNRFLVFALNVVS